MPYSIRKVDVWAAEIDDRPGGLADKLEALAKAGASLEFIVSRRAPDKPGKGVVFLTPVRGEKKRAPQSTPASARRTACIRCAWRVRAGRDWGPR